MAYQVKINKKTGTLDSELFEIMARNGDVTPTKLAEVIGQVVTITGYADCDIETEDKSFNILYVNTEELGIISSGSEIFKNSVVEYFGKCNQFRITEIKTKKGKTFKAVPELNNSGKKNEERNHEERNQEETTDELPF